ncbi:hypothetical protein [Terrabacter sp. BE26]|uniref:hypothetical protein n=1 Tax=Terrabacter sp. BE26 TaxID=2898152 RepID=UPI0035BE26F6
MTYAPNLAAPVEESTPQLASMSIRELIGALSATEDRLRQLPLLVPFGGRLITNPERRLLLRRQGMLIASLRRRRAALRASVASR